MPACARKEIVRDGEVAAFHCVTRCVRRAFLCGKDEYSGNDYEHRREWVRDRLEELAGIFAVDVLGYAVMSNHLHVVVRVRPDVVAAWSDEEVARRWWRLFPRRRVDGAAAEPEEHELQMLIQEHEGKGLAEKRRRLANVSWFMRCLSEPIARRANREDQCTGRFWEGRFKCQILLDETAILACSVYVDLNPIRAGIASTPETSQFTSACERIAGRQAERGVKTDDAGPENGGWLSPVELAASVAEEAVEPAIRAVSTAAVATSPSRRASDKGFLSLSLDDYLRLLDWTGREIRAGKRGAIPAELVPILERLQLNEELWLSSVQDFSRTFRRAAGCPVTLAAEAGRVGRRWLAGVRHSRRAFDG